MTTYSVELVITVPEQYGMLLAYQTKCRTTIGVLAQLLAQAKHRVIISAPFIQHDQGLSDGVLADALHSSLQRGVNIDVVSTGRGLHAIDRNRLLQKSVGKLQFFQPSANLTDKHKLGSHAKFCVADGTLAYVGSANLTSPGLSGQLEMGLLVCGEVAGQIEQFLDYAVELGLFVIVS